MITMNVNDLINSLVLVNTYIVDDTSLSSELEGAENGEARAGNDGDAATFEVEYIRLIRIINVMSELKIA